MTRSLHFSPIKIAPGDNNKQKQTNNRQTTQIFNRISVEESSIKISVEKMLKNGIY